jgi:GNAT superfamily N-acetyltransferase
MPDVTIRRAVEEDVSDVLAVLAEATAWLRTKGIVQWPDRFPRSVIAAALDSGGLFVATEGSAIVATVTLLWSDPSFWGDRDDAGFVHRLVVRRSHVGLGRTLLEWAADQVRSKGRSYVCLDCLGTNERMRRYYEDLGFRLVGEVPGPADHPHSDAHGSWSAALYEKAIAE